jgi:Cu2+-exporting ATPase
VTRNVVAASVAYNVLAVAISLTGHMTPLRAAVAMPLSSLLLIAYTAARLSDGRRRGPRAVRSVREVLA